MSSLILPQRWRKLLLVVHIAATVGAFGADMVLLVLALAGLGGADPVTIYPAAKLIGARIILPLALASLGSGLLLGLLTPWGLFRHWWVTAKLGIVLVLVVALLVSLVPGLSAVAEAVGSSPQQPLAFGDRLPLAIAPAVAVLLLAAALALAIFKPGRRKTFPPPSFLRKQDSTTGS